MLGNSPYIYFGGIIIILLLSHQRTLKVTGWLVGVAEKKISCYYYNVNNDCH